MKGTRSAKNTAQSSWNFLWFSSFVPDILLCHCYFILPPLMQYEYSRLIYVETAVSVHKSVHVNVTDSLIIHRYSMWLTG